MRLAIVTPPAGEPVTLAEAKSHLRVTIADDDARISRHVSAARQMVETRLGRVLITQGWDVFLDAFPSHPGLFDRRFRAFGFGHPLFMPLAGMGEIEVPLPPLTSVERVRYVDGSGVVQTLDPSRYRVAFGDPGRIVPALGQSWPSTASVPDAVEVRFVAGYANADAVPACAKEAVLAIVQRLYDGASGDVWPSEVDRILTPIRFSGGVH